jgi:S-adenosylmethionine synthetase
MKNYNYLFTSESVSEGHPDKVADQISDAILDAYLTLDPDARVACETFCTTDCVMVAGEITSTASGVDVERIIRDTIRRIGYDKPEYGFDADTCEIIQRLHEQSPDISRGVSRESSVLDQGAGDQGMMFGYACRDTEEYMPLAVSLAHRTLQILSDIRHNEPTLMPYLRPDAKTQFTVDFSARHKPLRVRTIVLSTQHDPFVQAEGSPVGAGDDKAGVMAGSTGHLLSEAEADAAMQRRIEADVRGIVLPRLIASLPPKTAALFDGNYELHVNPTGKFVIGGPAGDTGLTGRKIIVDTYGGRGAHGGGAFSGKDPSKVDRSAAYAARHIAKNLVAAGVCSECLVQLAYAIGVAQPVSVFVDSYGAYDEAGDAAIAAKVAELYDLRPAAIISRFGLKNPIYEPTASYGHFGKKPYVRPMKLWRDGAWVDRDVRFFSWEDLDMVPAIRAAFGL